MTRRTDLYVVDGVRVPSVTEILGTCGMSRFAGIEPHILEYAADRGTRVHKFCERIMRGEIHSIEDVDDEECVPYLAAFLKFLNETGFVRIDAERVVVSTRYRYAGTLDIVGRIDAPHLNINADQVFVIDLKAVVSVAAVTRLQTTGYALAYAEMANIRGIGRAALQVKRDGKYHFIPYDETKRDVNTWLAAVTLAHFQLANNIASIGEYRA